VNKQTAVYVLTGIGLGVAGVIAYIGTRSAGPVQLTQFTELREGPLQEHLVSREELGMVRNSASQGSPDLNPRHSYPNRVAPGLTKLISHGFAPLYCVNDPQIMALPAEEPW
jgi:hypothetical protein